MSDVRDWLTGLGLARYVREFEAAEIDLQTLPELSDADLQDLGLPLGPRRKIMAALREQGTPAIAQSAATVAAATKAERRHVTVLFADIVGSTDIASQTDPEVMGELLRNYQRSVSDEIERQGGYVAKFLGDGVMAYFGWPRAQEDAAERSVRAGLAVIAAVKQLAVIGAPPLQTRVGIASGNVVIGGIIGHGTAAEDAIAGDTPHLAARLQSASQPDRVLIADGTYRLIGSLFDCQFAGELLLKGFHHSISAWTVIAEAIGGQRYVGSRATRAGLIGRQNELDILVKGWRGASESGSGSAMVISGEAGIGKTRLIDALRTADGSAAHIVQLQCSAFHSTNALYPLTAFIEQAAYFALDDTAETRRKRLEDLFGDTPNAESLVLFITALLSPNEGLPDLQLTKAQRKSALIAGVANWIGHLGESRPVMLILEDAHWSDATTLELVTLLIARLAQLRLFIVVTGRPAFVSPWTSRAHVRHIALDRLAIADCEAVVLGTFAERALDRRSVQQIIQKSDGNPLFLQELTLGLLASGDNAHLVPDTLQDSLMARLDQLGDGKAVAQLAAVLGRKFARPLLAHVSHLPPAALDAELSALVTSELIYPTGRAHDGHFEFKHALLRDAAYESLLLTQRRELHAQIAAALEQHFPDSVDAEPELLAHHFAQAQNHGQAALYLEKAGDRAAARWSYPEASESFRAALEQLKSCEPSPALQAKELEIWLKIGTAASVVHGPNHSSAGEAYVHAAKLAEQLDDKPALFQAVWGLWLHANIGRNLDAARDFAEQLVSLSVATGDDEQALESIHCRWSTEMFRGDYESARRDADAGIERYEAARHHHLSSQFGGHDPGVCARGVSGITRALAGRPVDGLRLMRDALALANDLGHPHSIAHAGMMSAVLSAHLGDADAVKRQAQQVIEVAEKFNFQHYLMMTRYLLAWARDVEAESADELAALERDFPGGRLKSPFPILASVMVAERFIATGRGGQALDVANAMLGALDFPDLGVGLPELHRVRAEALALAGDRDAAIAAATRALQIAERQGAMLQALKARIVLTKLGIEDARPQLHAMVAAWPAGQDCKDIAVARALAGP